jgi:mannose/fructose/N-acetylgalactosamine-specific phosphotransferase system component IIB
MAGEIAENMIVLLVKTPTRATEMAGDIADIYDCLVGEKHQQGLRKWQVTLRIYTIVLLVKTPTRATEMAGEIADIYDCLVGENTNKGYGNGR